ncbi:MAG: maleylpyruvate isomerase N-terminal domain-containing protein, partial [Thermomicrobiales bacterium]|nr:maleylpyruvate isomerase N-terminal domain-containing protein [Thermomicrobiales bacterium]
MSAEQATTIERLQSARAAFDELLVAVGTDRMTQPMDASGWSVKDIVAHITAYERWTTAHLRGLLRGEPPTVLEQYGTDEAPNGADPFDLDTLNATMLERDRVLTLDEAMQVAGTTF